MKKATKTNEPTKEGLTAEEERREKLLRSLKLRTHVSAGGRTECMVRR